MSTLGVAVIAGTVAAAIYWLGYWHGRRAPLERPRHRGQHFHPNEGPFHPECPVCNPPADLLTRADRYRLAWLSARRRAHRGQLLARVLKEREDRP